MRIMKKICDFFKKQQSRVKNLYHYILDNWSVLNRISEKLKQRFYTKLRNRLTNRDFTIIANTCTAGILYHDLQCRFDSPTINIRITDDCFFDFVTHMDQYLQSDLEEVTDEGLPFPVGKLTWGDREVRIRFKHYHDFAEAKKKWTERTARIHWDNLYVVYNIDDPVTIDHELVQKFLALPNKHKVMLANCRGEKNLPREIVHMPMYNRETFGGKLFCYREPLRYRRWLYDYDFVSFFNNRQ